MEKCKEILLKNGQIFLSKANKARNKIARIACPWIPSGSNILVHSKSRVVFEILKEAYIKNGTFHVFVCQSAPDNSGILMMEELSKLGIECTLILDSAVGAVIEKVDFVLLGAEAVVESGGIINKIGTSSIGLCAKMLNKPVYVAVESFKFVRFYPLNNRDIPDEFKVNIRLKLSKNKNSKFKNFKYKYSTISSVKDLEKEHPLIDYTQPSLLTLLFTDIGIFTPSAVSDELVKLYL